MNGPLQAQSPFYGWVVVRAAFVIAALGWGIGFYGPAIYLKSVQDANGWSVEFVSAVVTLHFLVGAVAVANLPRLHKRFGLANVTLGGAVVTALGVLGWALCRERWQLVLAALFSGAGWVALGAVGINAMVSPWFNAKRPAALAMAYNGASLGGVIFSPLWVALIAGLGFPVAALVVCGVLLILVAALARRVLVHSPASRGEVVDGASAASPSTTDALPRQLPRPVAKPWRDGAFITLALGMALGLFAQIGLIAHLFSVLTPALGAQAAGFAAGMATAAAIVGRTAVGWLIRPGIDRRRIAALNYGVQVAGCVCFALGMWGTTQGPSVPWLLVGVVLFGLGIGNATSLPPLMVQTEFHPQDTARMVALLTATAQATYAFAPLVFGLVRSAAEVQTANGSSPGNGLALFAVAACIQMTAAACYLLGRGQFEARLT